MEQPDGVQNPFQSHFPNTVINGLATENIFGNNLF